MVGLLERSSLRRSPGRVACARTCQASYRGRALARRRTSISTLLLVSQLELLYPLVAAFEFKAVDVLLRPKHNDVVLDRVCDVSQLVNVLIHQAPVYGDSPDALE